MKVLKFTGKKYTGEIAFSGPGEMKIGTEVKIEEAERLVKDFPDRFEIVDTNSAAYKKEKKALEDEANAKAQSEAADKTDQADSTADDETGDKDIQPSITGDMTPDVTR